MEVILLEKVGKLGNIGDRINVKSGYGRNFLVPQGKAVYATEQNIAEFEARRAELEKAAAEKKTAAEARGAQLAGLAAITLTAHAGDEGNCSVPSAPRTSLTPLPQPVLRSAAAKSDCRKALCASWVNTKWIFSCTAKSHSPYNCPSSQTEWRGVTDPGQSRWLIGTEVLCSGPSVNGQRWPE